MRRFVVGGARPIDQDSLREAPALGLTLARCLGHLYMYIFITYRIVLASDHTFACCLNLCF